MSQSRQLAAIMFTDIVGYTSLMGTDEQKAFELLKKNRELQRPIIEQFKGTWIKELGDGVMASFNIVSDAVNAAIKIQDACYQTGGFLLRIGIHQGEVVFEEGDVFGDAVNIAAKIQGIARPGSIYVSESVHHNVSNKKGIFSQFVKQEYLKNVKDPIRIYEIKLNVSEIPSIQTPFVPDRKARSKPSRRIPFFLASIFILLITSYLIFKPNPENRINEWTDTLIDKSIAVLPFVDMSPDQDQEYLGDGLAEEINTVLSGINDLRVIGRTSSFQFKGEQMDLREIGKRLNTETILEGSVQKSGERIRITAQLIRVRDHTHLWSERFDREMTDIFKIQDEIATQVAERLKLTFNLVRHPTALNQKTIPEAYNIYLKGLHAYNAELFEQSIEYNLEAIRMDSAYAAPYAYIALAKAWLINRNRDFHNQGALAEAREYAYKSIALFPGLAEGHSALALMAWSIERSFPEAREFFEKSIQLNPNDALISNRYGYFLLWMADFNKAAALATRAMQSDPVDYHSYSILIRLYQSTGRLDEADRLIREGKRLFPNWKNLTQFEVNNSELSGHYSQVIHLCDSILRRDENPDPALLAKLSIAYFKTNRLPESNTILAQLKSEPTQTIEGACYHAAEVYASRNEPDSCFSWLNKSFDRLEMQLRGLKIDPVFDPLRNHPGFQLIYQKYGFDRYSL